MNLALPALVLSLRVGSAPVRADGGMWTYDNLPLKPFYDAGFLLTEMIGK